MARFFRLLFIVLMTCWITQSGCEKEGGTADAKVTGAGGSLARFAIIGNYLYTVSNYDMDVYDLSDPAKPVLKNTVPIGQSVETIFPFNDKLFIGGEFGMYIFSLAQPTNPVREGSVNHFRACDPVVANDSLAYVTLKKMSRCGSAKDMLHVYNIRNLQDPKLVYEKEMKSPGGLATKQNALYVCQAENGLSIFDLKDPVKPSFVKQLTDAVYYDLIPYGNLLIAYVDKGIRLFDVTDPLKPVLVSELKG